MAVNIQKCEPIPIKDVIDNVYDMPDSVLLEIGNHSIKRLMRTDALYGNESLIRVRKLDKVVYDEKSEEGKGFIIETYLTNGTVTTQHACHGGTIQNPILACIENDFGISLRSELDSKFIP